MDRTMIEVSDWIEGMSLSSSAFRVLAHLCRLFQDNGEINCSYKDLGDFCFRLTNATTKGRRNKAIRAVDELLVAGILKRSKSKSGTNNYTLIDPYKGDEQPLSLSCKEAEIEEYLYQNPQLVTTEYPSCVKRWIKRQFTLPNGIIDLLGVDTKGRPVLVELKKVEIDASALAQVCRYAYDLQKVFSIADHPFGGKPVTKIVVGLRPSSKTIREAEALGIHLYVVTPPPEITLTRLEWSTDSQKERDDQYFRLAQDEELIALARGHQ